MYNNKAKARPSYPLESINFIRQLSKKAPETAKILDLGAGTGIMTNLLSQNGYSSLTAVEPVDAMRAKINLPASNCLKGTSWSIPVDSESQDIVMLAQCFHWFDDIQSLKEIHRVLKPGGLLVLVWNMESKERSEWVAKLRPLYEAYDGSAPQYRMGYWKNVFDTPEAKSTYQLPLQHKRFEFDSKVKRSDVWTRITSKSYIAVLDQIEQDKLQVKVEQVLNEYDDIPKNDDELFIYPADTDMYWCYKN
ncbi:hypothetical protein INT48_009342 [Thamnidium elegans]|uniref:Methyltransferase type 11 domain-containing protein n=1 Tax=Thamnidium elegans TaxID=101142 RepID=A0A8H7SDJ3_9FUNG|nr:hypothetical protein INT48_009342 [Thamnidium elegans]